MHVNVSSIDFPDRLVKAALLVVAMVGAAIVSTGCKNLEPKPYNTFLPTNATPMQAVAFTNRINPEWLEPPEGRYKLGPGDRVEIDVMGETNANTLTIVGPDGKLYFNLLPGIDVWGLTLAETKARLESELAKYVRDRPQVSLILREVGSKRVWLLGRVQNPGVYPLQAPTTLLEAIANAGGTMSLSSYQDQAATGINEEMADLKRSFVVRQGRRLPIDFERLLKQGDLSQNVYLQPDDFIYLPAGSAREIYVLGAVAQPSRVPYQEGMTVASAVASAYGTIRGAYMAHVALVRGSLQEPQIAIVNYKGVIRGEAPDMLLQPNDIVYVPFSPYRYLYRYAQLVVDTFVSSSAINLGVKAIGAPSGGAAGIFIPVGSGIQIVPPANLPPIQ